MKTCYLTLCFVLASVLPLSSTAPSYPTKHTPALYVFGDSLVDCGNNNHLPTGGPSFLPYGIDFMHGKPTGRATNGKTVADFLAIHLGLPLTPPYLGLSKHHRNKVRTGINYASAGSGVLPDTNNDTSLTLDKQIKFFHRTIKHNLPKTFTENEELEKHISESLFFVSTGVNDYFHNGTFRGNKSFAFFLLREITLRIKRMYSLGARKFLVNNIPPAGCFPSKAIHTRPIGKCDGKINKGITFYNKRLHEVLHQLQSKLPGFTFIHADLYGFLKKMRQNGSYYVLFAGIVETWKPCCPNTIYGDLKCQPRSVPCANRNTHLFFDQNHPSQIANQEYARLCFNEKIICKPWGLKLF
ncbi:GDSL esterase/lipase At2g03980 isoform X1 [Vigna unguiculata]|uniref:GDSL esterase/lipase At2g03980 isoform X1 n=1 Tax=Vigna unguiculata TaxID=3917 RepID=UPI0010163F04|nr:GDSL esterase/lipase At2g03980 isoform X1 [Vigna unguiculata]XP_027913143.1 GDSL esterase/lipase At2g03980 isoform X1 [Vigna unguiculata]XP_027913144.1 GDSL esterase/lipase At2g03980 isoform X1 [Vigna unguiculata]XP_027913145.1 GDSL esterase/lipase At2g03980 isoform X1 [Vigna unguiculata]